LATCSAADVGIVTARAALVPGDTVGPVIASNVLAAGGGMNMARQIAVKLGLLASVPAYRRQDVRRRCGTTKPVSCSAVAR
jgi:acetyl-CoA acetyltransferase